MQVRLKTRSPSISSVTAASPANPSLLFSNKASDSIHTVYQKSKRGANSRTVYAVDGGVKAMATDTWWHGQKHYPARMGKAPWDAPWQYTQSLMGTAEGKGRSRKSQNLQWPYTRLPRQSSWRIRSCHQHTPSIFNILRTMLLAIFLPIGLSTAAFINFDNCLSPDRINSKDPKLLQFVPLFVWATFNTSAKSYNLNVTAYGNVTGLANEQSYPSQTDPQWANPNDTVGKIPDVYGSGLDALYTTFTTEFNVLDYTPYAPDQVRFCNTSSVTACPVAPVFNFTGNR